MAQAPDSRLVVSFAMRGEFLDLHGARIYYYAGGTRGAGDPVVFIHGFCTSGLLWGGLVPRLPPGRRAVVPDLLGYGRSDRPGRHPVDALSHANRTVELLDALRIERACLVGHGLGGGIAQIVALRHPKRVSSLCLVNSASFAAWTSRGSRFARASLPVTRHLPPEWLLAALRRRLSQGYVDGARGRRMVDRLTRAFEGKEGRAALVAHMRGLVNAGMVSAADLGRLAVPTAVVWGSEDPLLPVDAGRKLHAAIPGAVLHVLPGLRHFVPDEGAGPLAEVLERLLAA